MKTVDRARSSPRYRNDAVFRSAERLLNAPPAKPVEKPAPRWILFYGGIALGLTLALGLVLRIRRTPVQIGPVVVGSIFDAAPAPATTKPKPSPTAIAPANPSPAQSRSATLATLSPADAGLAATVISAQQTAAVNSARAAANNAIATSPARSQNSVAPLSPMIAEVTLRGELRSDKAAPVKVEFFLRRAIGSAVVEGTVRLLEGDARLAANAVKGAVIGRIMNLQETGSAWIRPEEHLGGPKPEFPVGRQFLINLSEQPASPELTGTWMFGSTRGTLSLVISPPW